ncbi:MAG: hypothetical protein FWH01_04970 [Oscillospiraceae bacterium]|nr:hypothetical protein [Oscillospiraceae bacterium]
MEEKRGMAFNIQMIPLKWRVGHAGRGDAEPVEFVPAAVPGAAQIDWARATDMPDWNIGVNYLQYRWMEDCFWIYRADLPKTTLGADEQLIFKCRGIDYKYEVYLDGEIIYAYEGMFRPFELDISRAAADGGELSIVVYPIPKNPDRAPDSREEASSSCKPAVSYGWDWHPRLVPSGIWDEASLCVVKKERILHAEVRYELSGDLKCASITVDAKIGDASDTTDSAAAAAPPGDRPLLRFRLRSPDGAIALESTDLGTPLILTDVKLWWCNGYGAPALYEWELLLERGGAAKDAANGRVGFRKVSLEMNPGAWSEPADFPKSRSHAPITLTLNNVPIFAKGTNWVNPEIFPGAISAETYRPLLERAQAAHFNLLRVWGGGIVNKDSFFDMCDSFGLMVWQEFPLACNRYPDTQQYLSTLESEATAIIKRLRKHACHVIWCGGNELFNNWSMMTDQSLPLRLLDKLCYELDHGKPYLPTSPISGMAHGCYLFVYPDGREVYKAMAEARHTAYTEFGVPSISNLDTCLWAAPRDMLFPMEKNEATVAHHAFGAWDGADDTWCSIGTLRRYLGEPASLKQLIEWSQWLQCEGYKCIYEEARRQKPYCSMALNWCYNEPWPTIANNSLLNYPASPKPAYYAVAEACRSRLASAAIPKFAWRPGEEFTAALWLLNDGQAPIGPGAADVYLEYGGERHFLLRWEHDGAPANGNAAGPTLRHRLAVDAADAGGVSGLGAAAGEGGAAGAGSVSGLGGASGCGAKFSELKLVISAGDMSSEYRLIITE